MGRMRIAVLLVAPAAIVAAGVVARAAPSPPPSTVACDEVIMHTKFPDRSGGARLVLGVVSVPPAYLPNVYPTGRRPWAYWRKAGLVVRAGRGPVRVSVAKEWRNRVAIGWGSAAGGSLRIARCSTKYELRDKDANGAPKMGNAYSGGFHLRSRAACVPLRRTGRNDRAITDPTGCGDAYAVGYLAARSDGLAPVAAARRATALVALLLSTRKRGRR